MLPPILLHYYITYQCNCKCRFCDIWKNENKENHIKAEFDDVKKNLVEARQLGVRFVDFTGGEPLLNPDLPDMLDFAKKTGLRTTLTTNCLRYPNMAQALKGRVDFLHFSLDSMNADDHDEIRGQKCFDTVMQSIDIARKLDEKPDLLYTVTKDNISQLSQAAAFARRTGFMLIVNPVFSHIQNHNLDSQYLDEIEQYANLPFVYVNKAFHMLRKAGGNNVNKSKCKVVNSAIVISPDNCVLLPCYHFYQKKIKISTSLKTIRQSPEFTEFLQKQGCFSFCQGCVLNCYFDPSFMYELDSYFLQSIQAKIKYSWYKYIYRYYLEKSGRIDRRPALEILNEINEKYDAI